jgi:hypothetical protein
LGVLPRKIVSRFAEPVGGAYYSAVFEIKKEIPVRAFVGSDRLVKLLSKLGGVR